MRAALYARVSTVDKDQNLQTQLRFLREHAEARAEGEPIGKHGPDRRPRQRRR